MGSVIEINDTLQINKEQGFPRELSLEIHLKKPLNAEDFKDRIFEFKNKLGIKLYKIPPVRNFLVENRNKKWIYWGLIHILEIHHDYGANTTSGKFKLIYIYTPEEMKKAHELVDRNKETQFFK